MQRILLTTLISLFILACNQSSVKTKRNSDPLEAGREFIEASLKGDYDYAKQYLLPDTTNLMSFDRFVEVNKNLPAKDKDGYKDANIIIDSTQTVSDSVTILNYSNTYKKKPSKIKLVKKNNEWLVDFKYTFLDSL